jgi:valyl-tRNA synthetase
VEANRNFANKLWNAGRLIIGSIPQAPAAPANPPEWTLADSYIWARMKEIIRSVETLFQGYQFGEAGRQIYDFFWSEFADWYLEITKLQINEGGDRAYYTVDLMTRIFDYILRLLHPFTPFVTEEIWQTLKKAAQNHSEKLLPQDGKWAEALIITPWPQTLEEEGWEAGSIATFNQMQEIIRAIRNVRAEKNVKPATKISAVFSTSHDFAHLLRHEINSIAVLAGLNPESITLVDTTKGNFHRPEGHIALVAGEVEIYLPMADLVNKEEEHQRLNKELAEVRGQIERLTALLAGPFAEKAPAAVVQKEREKLSTFEQTAEKLQKQLSAL